MKLDAVPALARTRGSRHEGPGRRWTTLKELRATVATVVHTAWLERRARNPLIWCLPLAVLVAAIGPR